MMGSDCSEHSLLSSIGDDQLNAQDKHCGHLQNCTHAAMLIGTCTDEH